MLIITNPDDPTTQPKKVGVKAQSFIKKMVEDKKLIREYITEGKDLSELAKKREIHFAKPI